jgi:hypothetical protein
MINASFVPTREWISSPSSLSSYSQSGLTAVIVPWSIAGKCEMHRSSGSWRFEQEQISNAK